MPRQSAVHTCGRERVRYRNSETQNKDTGTCCHQRIVGLLVPRDRDVVVAVAGQIAVYDGVAGVGDSPGGALESRH